jgi:hypothetical protein
LAKAIRSAGIQSGDRDYVIGRIMLLKKMIRDNFLGAEAKKTMAAFEYGVMQREVKEYWHCNPAGNMFWHLEGRLDVAEAVLGKTTGSATRYALEAIPGFAYNQKWLTYENGLRLAWIAETVKCPAGYGYHDTLSLPRLASFSIEQVARNADSDPERDLPAFMNLVQAVTAEPLVGRWGAFLPLRGLVVNGNFYPATDLPAFRQAFGRIMSVVSDEEAGPVFFSLWNAISNDSFEPEVALPTFASVIEGIAKNTSGDARIRAMNEFFSFIEEVRAFGLMPLQSAAAVAGMGGLGEDMDVAFLSMSLLASVAGERTERIVLATPEKQALLREKDRLLRQAASLGITVNEGTEPPMRPTADEVSRRLEAFVSFLQG